MSQLTVELEQVLRAVPCKKCHQSKDDAAHQWIDRETISCTFEPDYTALSEACVLMWEQWRTAVAPADFARSVARMLAKFDDEDTAAFNECIFMARWSRAGTDALKLEVTTLNTLRVQLSTDSQNHLDRALRAERRLTAHIEQTARLYQCTTCHLRITPVLVERATLPCPDCKTDTAIPVRR